MINVAIVKDNNNNSLGFILIQIEVLLFDVTNKLKRTLVNCCCVTLIIYGTLLVVSAITKHLLFIGLE